MQNLPFDQYLDATELNCPMPLLKMKQALRYLEPGQVLKIEATDAGSQRDFNAFVNHSEHQMLEEYCVDGVYGYLIQKG
ncbi:MAG: sulfurtransferase TusA family protein [Pseudomonadales bacterium]